MEARCVMLLHCVGAIAAGVGPANRSFFGSWKSRQNAKLTVSGSDLSWNPIRNGNVRAMADPMPES